MWGSLTGPTESPSNSPAAVLSLGRAAADLRRETMEDDLKALLAEVRELRREVAEIRRYTMPPSQAQQGWPPPSGSVQFQGPDWLMYNRQR